MAHAAKNKRRKYWIDPSFQGRFLRMILTLLVLTTALGSVLPLALAFVLYLPATLSTGTWNLVILGFAALAVGISLTTVYMSVRASHRICGPIYRIEKSLGAIEKGERPDPIRLRKGDELQDLVDRVNRIAANLTANVAEIKPAAPPEPVAWREAS